MKNKYTKNKYVSVVVEGRLDTWTGNNPDKDPKALGAAMIRAELLRREGGKRAYPVVIEEIKSSEPQLSRSQLQEIVTSIRDHVYPDPQNPDKPVNGGDLVEHVCCLLKEYGLAPKT